MASRPPRHYWDANVFLSYLDETPHRIVEIVSKFAESQRGDIEIITSTVSMTEVAFGADEKAARRLDPAIEARINNLWIAPSPVRVVEYNQLIALEARRLMRRAMAHGKSLKPADAVHLGTAVKMGAVRFDTYDDRLFGHADMAGLPIGPPQAQQYDMFAVEPEPEEKP